MQNTGAGGVGAAIAIKMAIERAHLDEAFPRLVDVAKGAAMMTGTTLEKVEVLGGGNEVVVNQTLADLFVKNMNDLGDPSFTEEDYAFAKNHRVSGDADLSWLFFTDTKVHSVKVGPIVFCYMIIDKGYI